MSTVDTNGHAADRLVGRTVAGRYEVVRRIAAGGMGVVYEATQQPLGRRVALKVIRGSTFDAVTRGRFEREARTTASLHDPHVVIVHDFGVVDELDGGLFLAMEFVDGETLRARLGRLERLGWRSALAIVTQVARALAAAHAARLVHRDLKPENIMVATDEQIDDVHCKVLDFGLAKSVDNHLLVSSERNLTNSGSFVGTPGYISPEILNGDDEHPRQDVYALGVIWWELLCGRHPFDAPTPMKTLVRQMHEDPPPLTATLCPPDDVPADGALLLRAMMAREPGQRPRDGRELLQRLLSLPTTPQPLRPTPHDAVTIGEIDARTLQALQTLRPTPATASATPSTPAPSSAAPSPPAASSVATDTAPTATATAASPATSTSVHPPPPRRPWLWLVGGAALATAATTAVTTMLPAVGRDDEPAPVALVSEPAEPSAPGVVQTEVVVDGLPAYGLVRPLRALLPAKGAVRRFKTAHLELVLDGDHADAIYDALQGHVLSADGHAVQLVIDESEPGRVALRAVSLDDAGVTDGTARAADARPVPLFDEPAADAGSAADAGAAPGDAVDASAGMRTDGQAAAPEASGEPGAPSTVDAGPR